MQEYDKVLYIKLIGLFEKSDCLLVWPPHMILKDLENGIYI